MSHDADYLYALEMQKRWNGDADGESDIEEIEFKPPPMSKKPLHIVKRSNPRSNLDEEFLNRTQNLVHPQWETLDPTPDIFSLFGAFDMKFFQGRLKCVTIEWSKRMYSCAGICYSRSNRMGMDVTIRLSEPLLKLRPRKDLVETMLHEMIHAYCFVKDIREGNGGHGPVFKKMMQGINKVAGTNITVYHTFHDEVDLYKQHWWRCNGSCQNRSPFFGYVKRTCNRAPGPSDQWWFAHLESCGGTFMKIKEPEKKKKEKAVKSKDKDKKPVVAAGGDLRKFFPTNGAANNSSNITGFGGINGSFKGPIKMNGGGTMVLNPKTKPPSLKTNNVPTNTARPTAGRASIASAFPPSSYPGMSSDPFNANTVSSVGGTSQARHKPIVPPGSNLRNVMGFRDLNAAASKDEDGGGGGGNPGRAVSGFQSTPKHDMVGRGYSLDVVSAHSNIPATLRPASSGEVDRKHLRDLWAKKFSGAGGGGGNDKPAAVGAAKTNRQFDEKPPSGDAKRRRVTTDGSGTTYIADEIKKESKDDIKLNSWVVLDDDIMLQDQPMQIIALSSDSDSDATDFEVVPRPLRNPIKLTADERQIAIKREIMDESMDADMTSDDIVLIDDDYNDDEDLLNTSAAVELADTSVIDDLFGEDTLMKEFKRENDVVPTGSRHVPNPQDDIITCPICQGKMKRILFADHLNGCTGIAVKILAPKHSLKKLSDTSRQWKPQKRTGAARQSAKDILRNAGYSEQDLYNIASASSAEEDDLNSSSLLSPPANTTTNARNVSSIELDESTRRYRQRNLFKSTRQCPVCSQEIEEEQMNDHLDDCLSK